MIVFINQGYGHLCAWEGVRVPQNWDLIFRRNWKIPSKVQILIVSIERSISPNLTRSRVKFKGEVDQLIWRRINAVAEEQKSYVGKYFEKEIKSVSSR